MARKRVPFSFPELEPKGRGAILRSADEVKAEQELLQGPGDSPPSQQPPSPAPSQSDQPTKRSPRPRAQKPTASSSTSEDASGIASTQASMLANYPAATIEAIRKVVKVPGREVSFVRLTPEEKGQLTDLVYSYKRQGRKTTENEINRIAVNFILNDYQANGEQSVIARVLEALSA
jgi:hypothetical protein